MTLLVTSFLSILLFTATVTVLLAHKSQIAFERSVDLFHIAEAGLARAQALCRTEGDGTPGQAEEGGTEGDSEPETQGRAPDQWVLFAGGSYLLRFYYRDDPHPGFSLPEEAGDTLVEAEARLEPHLRTRIYMVLKAPPSCTASAWWQGREM